MPVTREAARGLNGRARKWRTWWQDESKSDELKRWIQGRDWREYRRQKETTATTSALKSTTRNGGKATRGNGDDAYTMQLTARRRTCRHREIGTKPRAASTVFRIRLTCRNAIGRVLRFPPISLTSVEFLKLLSKIELDKKNSKYQSCSEF